VRWNLVAGAVLSTLGLVAAVLLVARSHSGTAATPTGTATTATTVTTATTSTGFAIVDTPTAYCSEDTEDGKTYVWHWSDDEQKLVKGCLGANVP
jgi:hypothetical protein